MTEFNKPEVLTSMPPKNWVHPPLNEEKRESVGTSTAAYHLNRAEQTLRFWACSESGPIQPRRINGRLHWFVADIRKLLGVEADYKSQNFAFTELTQSQIVEIIKRLKTQLGGGP